MTEQKPVTAASRAVKPPLSRVERLAAQTARLATRQDELKQEAAERRVAREARDDGSPTPRRRRAAAKLPDGP